MNFKPVSVNNVDNSVENSNFSRSPFCFNHKFFFRNHNFSAYKRDIILLPFFKKYISVLNLICLSNLKKYYALFIPVDSKALTMASD